MATKGTSKLAKEGMNTAFMMAKVVICPPIHNMVVVTSPIGVQAPPALAAITMMPAKNKRSSRLSSSFFISETITIAVVRLSKMALRKKVTKPTSHIKLDKRVVRMRSVMTAKPLCASTTSTMVIAPMRKNTICAVPSRDVPNSWATASGLPACKAYTVHNRPAPNKAEADLLTLSGCSKAMAA